MNYEDYAKELFACFHKFHKYTALRNINDSFRGEMAVLTYLSDGHDGATAGELTRIFQIGSSRIAAILNTLEKKNLARRMPDPKDKRKVCVCITDTGRNLTLKKKQEALGYMTDFLSSIGEEDTATFLRIIQKFTDQLE